ncbi:MAG: hypothetical protein Q4A21_00160 [bacterium]|nr:hypothetical protein [bacterium]
MDSKKRKQIAQKIYPDPKDKNEQSDTLTAEEANTKAYLAGRAYLKERESKFPIWMLALVFLLFFLPVGNFIPISFADMFWRLICAVLMAYSIRSAWIYGDDFERNYGGRSINKSVAKLVAILFFLAYFSGFLWQAGGMLDVLRSNY